MLKINYSEIKITKKVINVASSNIWFCASIWYENEENEEIEIDLYLSIDLLDILDFYEIDQVTDKQMIEFANLHYYNTLQEIQSISDLEKLCKDQEEKHDRIYNYR